jgi:hypothetical protein
MRASKHASEVQVKANRCNGKKGGVKTRAGKMISRMNAYKHGGLSSTVLEGELPTYRDIHDALMNEFSPAGFVEKVLVERIVLCVLQMRRISFAVNEFMRQIEQPEVSKSMFEFEEKTIIDPGYEPAITTDQIERILDLYNRYEVSLENRFLKLVKELNLTRAAA